MDDPAYDLCHCFGSIIEELFRAVRSHGFHGNAENDGPEKDADVISLQEGADRIVNGAHHQVEEHFPDAAGRRGVGHADAG